jgi:hypothetical protein
MVVVQGPDFWPTPYTYIHTCCVMSMQNAIHWWPQISTSFPERITFPTSSHTWTLGSDHEPIDELKDSISLKKSLNKWWLIHFYLITLTSFVTAATTLVILRDFAYRFSWCIMQWHIIKLRSDVLISSVTGGDTQSVLLAIFGAPAVTSPACLHVGTSRLSAFSWPFNINLHLYRSLSLALRQLIS